MAAFVLGNGISRGPIDIDLLKTRGDVYACNAVYRTHRVTALVATDRGMAEEIQASGYPGHNRFYTRRPNATTGAQRVPQEYFGYSSGPIALALACADGHDRIYLLGFDLGPTEQGRFNNLFAGTAHYKSRDSGPTFSGNWIKQIMKIGRDFPAVSVIRVHGATTAEVPEFGQASNLSRVDFAQFIERINTGKDL